MGKQGNIKYIGTVDNLIYYKWKDIYAVRSKPVSVKQTAASKAQSKLFGVAAHSGAVLRSLLKPALPDAKDKGMMRRFEQAIVQWLRTDKAARHLLQGRLPFITGFEFNEKSLLHSRLKEAITVNMTGGNMLRVQLPPLQPRQHIAAPANTSQVVFTIRAAACSLLNDDVTGAAGKTITVDYNNNALPAQEVELPVVIGAGVLAVVTVSLQYVVKGNIVHDMRWMPAGVADSFWGGE